MTQLNRRSLLVRLGSLVLLMSFCLGNRNCEEHSSPTLSCQDATIRVESGSCTRLQNPCVDGLWAPPWEPEGFRFELTEEQSGVFAAAPVSLLTTRAGDETTRSICVAAGSPLIANAELPFVYARRNSYGIGSIFLTVAPPLVVEATASPSAAAVGDSSQLLAIVSGGVPPYFYSWVPASRLDDNDIAAPITTPRFTTTYTVGVADSSGLHASATVTVHVREQLTVTANPASVLPGERSQLEAIVEGGTPPYTYAWTPAEGLDDPRRSDPLAAPTATTTYGVTVTDAAGATLNGAATLVVRDAPGPPPPTASFVFNVLCCPTFHVDAGASTGDIVSYTWDLGWTAASPDLVTSSPTAAFTIREFDRGTIRLTVADASGRTATTTLNF
jgi:hypothetical protein